jgi:hypothetical protein
MSKKLQKQVEELRRTLNELLGYLPEEAYSEFGRDTNVLQIFITQLESALRRLRGALDPEYFIPQKKLKVVEAYSSLKDLLRNAIDFVKRVERQGSGNEQNTETMRIHITACLGKLRAFMELEKIPSPEDTVSSPLDEYRRSLISFYDKNKEPVGVGVLMPNRHVLSCAHVVSRALNVDFSAKTKPEGDVSAGLIFPVRARRKFCLKLLNWGPSEDHRLDFALLEIKSPRGITPRNIRFLEADDLWSDPFRMYGFPAGRPAGGWATGRVLDVQLDGLLQLEDTKNSGYCVQPGFSGSPVWDEKHNGIVGIVVAADPDAQTRTGYALTVRELAKRCSFNVEKV